MIYASSTSSKPPPRKPRRCPASPGLYDLNITAEHLAPTDQLQSGGTAFVVWARKDDNATWSRIGALTYDADGRKGALTEASVPLTAFDLIISIEEQAAPASPSPHVVITQRVQD